jgi:hypothetical protein
MYMPGPDWYQILHSDTSTALGNREIQAQCPSSLLIGDVVYISGPKSGALYSVQKVNIDSAVFIEAVGVGIIIAKSSPTEATILLDGIVKGLYNGMNPGKRLYVNTDGRLIEGPPTPLVSSGTRMIHRVGYVLDAGDLFFSPEEPIRSQK